MGIETLVEKSKLANPHFEYVPGNYDLALAQRVLPEFLNHYRIITAHTDKPLLITEPQIDQGRNVLFDITPQAKNFAEQLIINSGFTNNTAEIIGVMTHENWARLTEQNHELYRNGTESGVLGLMNYQGQKFLLARFGEYSIDIYLHSKPTPNALQPLHDKMDEVKARVEERFRKN